MIGKSAPADPKNFSQELGRKLSREDAMRHVRQLEGNLFRELLSGS